MSYILYDNISTLYVTYKKITAPYGTSVRKRKYVLRIKHQA